MFQLHSKHESYVDYHITKVENQNVLNPSKQSLKHMFVFKYSKTYSSNKKNTKQIATKERLTQT